MFIFSFIKPIVYVYLRNISKALKILIDEIPYW